MVTKFGKILLLAIVFLTVSCTQERTTQEYMQSGQEMLEKKDWKSAVIEFRNALKQSPDNDEARVLLARASVLLGESYLHIYLSNSAVIELERARALGHEDDFMLVLLGEAYLQINDNEGVLEKIQVSASQSPTVKAGIHAVRARSLLRMNKLDEAKTELDLAKSLDENSQYVRIAWAQYEKINNNLDAQRKWLNPLIENGEGLADAWSQLGEVEQQENNLDAAEHAFTQAIKLRGVVHFDEVKRAMVRIRRNDFEGAIQDLNTLKKAGYPWPMIGYAEGLMASQKKDYDGARGIFEKLLSEYPDYFPAWLLLGLTQYEVGNYKSAVTNLGLYLANVPDSFQANLIYAVSLVKLEKVAEAIPVLEKLYREDSANFQVLSNLGYAYLVENQLAKSVQMLNGAIALNPDHAPVRLQLAQALLREEPESEEAQQQLIKAIQLDPELVQAEQALFMIYLRSKEFQKARKVAQNMKQKYPESVEGVNFIGLSYAAEGNKVRAKESFKEALQLFPANPAVSHNLAKIYYQENQLAEAKKLYLNVLEENPADLKTFNQLALISAREGDREKLLGWLQKAVEKNPHVLSAKLALAAQYLRNDDPNLAVQILQSVKREYREDPGYAMLMAQAKMGVKEYQHATRILKSLLLKYPDSSQAYYLLAKSFAYREDQVRLREALRKAIKLDPENFSAHLMSARLELSEGNMESFEKKMEVLVRKYPHSKAVQFLNAKLANTDEQYENAIKTLKVLMIEAPHSEVVIDLSQNLWNTGDKAGAISGLELWLEDNQKDQDVLLALAQFYMVENREAEAINAYQKLNELTPDNYVVLNNLAWLMKDTDVKQGIIYAEKALKINPDKPLIADTLAMLLLKNGDNEQALLHSKAAAQELPGSLDVQLNYVKVLSANNRKKQARELLNELMSNTGDTRERKAISEQLNRL